MDWLLGTVEEQAQKELAEYNPKTGQRKQDWGDIIGDKIFGRKEAIDKAVADLHVSNLIDNYGTQINRYGDVVGGEDVSNLKRLTAKQVVNRLASNRELMGARSEAGATTGDDITTFQDLNTPEAVRARASKLIKETQEGKEAKAENKLDLIRSEGRLDRNLQRQLTAENNKMQLQLEYARLAQADKFRVQDRKDQAIMALMSGLSNLGAGFAV